MGAGASSGPTNALFSIEQKTEIKKFVGIQTTKEWVEGGDMVDLDKARAEVVRLRKLVAEAVRDASTSRGTKGEGELNKARIAVRDAGLAADDVYKPVKFDKSPMIEAMLRSVFKTNKLFEKSLKPSATDEASALVDSFEPRAVKAGEVVIKQGDAGDYFYVIEEGSVAIFVAGNSGELNVGSLSKGQSFGELALMYGTPRAATVKAEKDCKLWQISRKTYRGIQMHFTAERLKKYVAFVKEVTIGDGDKTGKLGDLLSKTELEKLVGALDEELYPKGTIITRQGQEGDYFYIIEEGEVNVYVDKNAPPFASASKSAGAHRDTIRGDTKVAGLKTGAIFGEKALLKDDVRNASIVAESDQVLCLTLAREDFTMMLGSVAELLNTEKKKSEEPEVAPGTRDASAIAEEEDWDMSNLKLVRTLGHGAFGRVKLCKHQKNNQVYALKCQSKAAIVNNCLQDHILMEKTILQMLDHPFILKLFSALQDDRYIYFVLELLQGGELFTWLRKTGRFDEKDAKFFSGQVVLGFWHMHTKKVAYRDLKPENLVLDSKGYLKIVDLGLAKVVDGKTWTLCGTPDYLAPEIILNEGHDKAVDYWALGVLIFELVAGVPPFYADDPMEVYEKILSSSMQFPGTFGKNLCDIIRKLLKLSQSKRLGNGKGGCQAITKHKWFSGFDWDGLLAYSLSPPFKIEIKSDEDASNFDTYDDSGEEVEPCPDWNPKIN